MAEFPIVLLFDEVGTVSWMREGLYYCYRANISCPVEKFYRLYMHQGGVVVPLGIFSPQGELHGKIAANRMHEGEPIFTLTESLWYPKYRNNAGETTVAATSQNDEETLLINRFKPLPQEVLPYVCFLCPTIVESLPCLTVTLDKQGRPVVREGC